MEIPVNKTTLASALTALGKLVSRTSLIKMYQGIEITGRGSLLMFRTRNVTEEIEFRLFAELEENFPATLVEFEQFRQTVRNSKNKTLKLEIDNGEVFIDGVKLAPLKGHFPPKEKLTDHEVSVTQLPADTLSALSMLAPVTDKGQDICKVLAGINLSKDGFTATNGKELLNIPIPLEMNESITIPFPLVLLATKAFGESGCLLTWQRDEDTYFEVALTNWSWRAKALKGKYPNWKVVVPERKAATHYVSFGDDRADRLKRYLKSIPDDKEHNNGVKLSRLPEVPDNLHLESSNGMLFSILAEFDPNWGDLSVVVRKEFLLRLLEAGHRKIELNDAYGPIVGTGGTGQYVAMPIFNRKPQTENTQTAEMNASSETAVQTEVQPEVPEPQPVTKPTESVSEQIPPHPQENSAIPNTPSTKETKIMNENPTITHTVSAPMQTSVQNHEPENKLNPLDELIANIDALKAKLTSMFDESSAMARMVREAAITLKQKEREYQQTKRTIERIRAASGAA